MFVAIEFKKISFVQLLKWRTVIVLGRHYGRMIGKYVLSKYLYDFEEEYTKYPCFMCFWKRRAKHGHWYKVLWPKREKMML